MNSFSEDMLPSLAQMKKNKELMRMMEKLHEKHEVYMKHWKRFIRGYSKYSLMKQFFQKWKGIKKISYSGSQIILSPLRHGGNSERDYLEQINRMKDGLPHVWDDSQHNTAVIGDFFGYVKNQKKIDKERKTDGSVELYKILDIKKPIDRLPTWSSNVGQEDRNVLCLSKKRYYKGTFKEMKELLCYSPNFNLQGTFCVKSGRALTYFDTIFH